MDPILQELRAAALLLLVPPPVNATLSCGAFSPRRRRVPATLSKLKVNLSAIYAVKAVVTRNATTALAFSPRGVQFQNAFAVVQLI
ncbi:hypothetical protein BN946_scf184992.g37 [Trametes cinnabarina]|uniref:Secreted protein n=1 Tax=Pycnoporus cinnabarinus TaxID=5643 RepID=A0A060S9L8_PYCCI|nr:hypothetical protein BN946_scf184992.g37 [Trametes cinnabarina]